MILGEVMKVISRTAVLDFQKANFDLVRDLVERVPREVAMNGKAVQEGWAFFMNEILKFVQMHQKPH